MNQSRWVVLKGFTYWISTWLWVSTYLPTYSSKVHFRVSKSLIAHTHKEFAHNLPRPPKRVMLILNKVLWSPFGQTHGSTWIIIFFLCKHNLSPLPQVPSFPSLEKSFWPQKPKLRWYTLRIKDTHVFLLTTGMMLLTRPKSRTLILQEITLSLTSSECATKRFLVKSKWNFPLIQKSMFFYLYQTNQK